MEILKEELIQFTARTMTYSLPKGVILYGPPGTGKSEIIKSVCRHLGLPEATTPMAAGDLKKGIVGDSEKTINAIAARATIIPWELCILIIDEIDSLAPDRSGKDSSTGSQDMIGVFLSLLDGAKKVPNLKIFATTNFLTNIDKAFLRRMEIQQFLGNPSRSSRQQWITHVAAKNNDHERYSRMNAFATKKEYEDLRTSMINGTINFSADAYRKVLERYFQALLEFPKGEPNHKDYKELMTRKINSVAEEMNIKLRGKFILKILEDSNSLYSNCLKSGRNEFLKYAKKSQSDNYRVIMADLATQKSKEVIQTLTFGQGPNPNEEMWFDALKSVFEGAKNSKAKVKFHHYAFAVIAFPFVQHEGDLSGFNMVRSEILEHEDMRVLREQTTNDYAESVRKLMEAIIGESNRKGYFANLEQL